MKTKRFIHSYSNDIQNKRVVVLGLIPPPLGGIAVHINRVIYKLKQQNNKVLFIHAEIPWYGLPFYFIKIFFLFIYFQPHIVIFNSVYLKQSLLQLSVLVFLKKIVRFKFLCIEHNCRHMYTRSKTWRNIFNKVLKVVDKQIFIGTSTYQSYQDNKIVIKNFSIESAFLPPIIEDKTAILKTYPTALHLFLQKHKPLLLVNASQLVLLDGNKDLYGVDQCIDLMYQLKKIYPDTGFIFTLAKVGNEKYFLTLQKKMESIGVKEHFFVLTGQKELWPLFKKVNVFLRPTLSDGASVSIEEALYFNTPVLASNVVDRPQGVILFDSNKKNDFLDKVMGIIDQHVNSYGSSGNLYEPFGKR